MRAVPLICLLSAPLAAQTGEPRPGQASQAQAPDFPALVELVDGAHRKDPGHRKIDQFEATLRIKNQGLAQENNVEVRIEASFLAPRLIKYRVDEDDNSTMRGWDEEGPWAKTKDGVKKLGGRTYQTEIDALSRDRRLARQLLGYLDPKRTIGKLEINAQPRAARLELGPRLRTPCFSVTGTVDDFPINQKIDRDAGEKVQLRLWIDRETSRLTAVEARPTDPAGKPRGNREMILLRDFVDRGGVLLPTSLFMYREGRKGWSLDLEVEVEGIDLDAELTAKDLARPQR